MLETDLLAYKVEYGDDNGLSEEKYFKSKETADKFVKTWGNYSNTYTWFKGPKCVFLSDEKMKEIKLED